MPRYKTKKMSLSSGSPSPSTSWSSNSHQGSQSTSSLPIFSSPRSSRFAASPNNIPSDLPGASQYNFGNRPSTPVFELDEEIVGDDFIMAIAWKKKCIGAAYYSTGSYEMFVVPDIPEDSADYGVLKSLFFQVKPNILVVSCKQDSGRKKVLKKLAGTLLGNDEDVDDRDAGEDNSAEDENSDSDDEVTKDFNLEMTDSNQQAKNCRLHFVPNNFFSLAAARRRLMALRLPQESTSATDIEHYAYLRSVLPINSIAAIQATGALLKYLEHWRKTNKSLLWEGFGPSSVLSISTQTLDSLLWMDEAAFRSLQIFAQESHPSSAKRGIGSKEGLSLFGVFSHCKSTPGTQELRLMFLRPTRDVQVLRQRHLVMEFTAKPQNSHIVASLLDCLRKIKPVTTAVVRIAELRSKMADWKRLVQTLTYIAMLGNMCKELPRDIPLFRDIAEHAQSEKALGLAQTITDTISFEEWDFQGRFTVNVGVDDELDELKRRQNAIATALEEFASLELEKLPDRYTSSKYTYFPEIGFLLGIPRKDFAPERGSERSLAVYGLVYRCDKNGYAFFQSWRCNEVNDLFGDLMPTIVNREIGLLIDLSLFVLKNFRPLSKILQFAGQLDALIAMGSLIGPHRLIRPVFVEDESGVEIEEGRHFLHEMVSDNYIPNETVLGLDGYPRIFYISGPNASGKSNYLKQIALMVYMAHIGCYVPAKSMRLSTFDRIFAITQTVESSAVPLSHFAIHLTLMSSILRSATRNSLVILDEFGKGTRDLDGMALLFACIRHWCRQGSDGPMLLISSHFHYVCQSLKRRRNHHIFFGYMDYILDEEVVFLYQLVPGASGASLPLQVAKVTGVRHDIVARARQVLDAVIERRQIQPLESLTTDALYPGLRRTLDNLKNYNGQDWDDILTFLLTKVVNYRWAFHK